MTLNMTTAQVVETSVTVTNSSFQNYTHPDDHTTRTTDTPGFKPVTTLQSGRWKVKPIRFDLSAGSCARFGQGNRRSEGETEAKETCVTSVIQ